MAKLVITDKDGREVTLDARTGISIMENIRLLPRSVEAICGGMCACATCHVYVDPEWVSRLPARSYEELCMLRDSASYDPARSRLSCQLLMRDAFDGLRLTVAPDAD
jgi:ferredoxin, 2Fe-2S